MTNNESRADTAPVLQCYESFLVETRHLIYLGTAMEVQFQDETFKVLPLVMFVMVMCLAVSSVGAGSCSPHCFLYRHQWPYPAPILCSFVLGRMAISTVQRRTRGNSNAPSLKFHPMAASSPIFTTSAGEQWRNPRVHNFRRRRQLLRHNLQRREHCGTVFIRHQRHSQCWGCLGHHGPILTLP